MSLVSSDLNQVTPEKTGEASVKPDRVKVASPLAEFKNGKVIFKQKPISFENLSETMQEIVSFRDCIKDISNPLPTIPVNHLPLIAKLVHESDKSITTLTKNLQSLLLPPTLESSSQVSETEVVGLLTLCVVENAIKAVAERVNYGIDADTEKPPAGLCVWRWEVKNKDWLPKSMSDKVCQRFHERVAAKEYLQSIFDALPENERCAVLQHGKNKLPKGKGATTEATHTCNRDPNTSGEKNNTCETSENRESSSKKPSRAKKPFDPEILAKEKEKQEKKVIKAEKDKKVAEATKKSAAVFATFFKPVASKPIRPTNTAQAQSTASGSSTQTHSSEFQLTFKPFVVKKDAHLAPVNYFVAQKRRREQQSDLEGAIKEGCGIIDLVDEGKELQFRKDHSTVIEVDNKDHVSRWDAQEVLGSFVGSQPPSLQPISGALAARRFFKAEPKYCVRKIMHQLNDAEVQGDQRTTRKLTALLRNRQKIPAKFLVFHENNRPGYIGTWTRSSPSIGPRTPFARDLLSFDYDHDSDAEWEEEEGSADDVNSQEDSNEDDRSSVGSDMDDWLVESDEIELDLTDAPDDSVAPPANSTAKRKSTGPTEPPNKKRKVVPLIPFQKGPVWEKEIGDCDYELFKPMRIRLFNDTPFPVDPFTFVSDPVIVEKANSPGVKASDGLFVIPAVPERLLPKLPLSTDESVVKRKVLNSAPPPKTSFPDTHIPLLLQKIDDSTTSSFVVLLDSLFQDLKPFGVKKNALEVKLREVSEKDKSKRTWVVKEQAWSQYGLIKPACN